MAKQLGKRDNSNTVLIQYIKSEKDTTLYIDRMESDVGRHNKSSRHKSRQRESHFSLPRSHFSLTLLEGEVTSPYSSGVAWALLSPGK